MKVTKFTISHLRLSELVTLNVRMLIGIMLVHLSLRCDFINANRAEGDILVSTQLNWELHIYLRFAAKAFLFQMLIHCNILFGPIKFRRARAAVHPTKKHWLCQVSRSNIKGNDFHFQICADKCWPNKFILFRETFWRPFNLRFPRARDGGTKKNYVLQFVTCA